MLEIPFRILSFCLDGEPFAFCEFVSVATFVGITFCVYLLALPFSCQHFLYIPFVSFFLCLCLFLFSFCCSSYVQVCCQLRFVFANHYYLHLRNFLFLRCEKKDIWLAFAFFMSSVKFCTLIFMLVIFFGKPPHPLWISLAHGNIFIELWQSTRTLSREKRFSRVLLGLREGVKGLTGNCKFLFVASALSV